ncbi:proteasome regulatory particle subunit [Savitreella phatthalungensis]
MVAQTTAETVELTSTVVTVHPLVLLSVADSYNRSASGTKRRVVGVLLGQNNGKTVNVANSFAVPFEEDEKNPSVWFLDHNFVESMYDMYKKINAKEKMIGWYHSGPKLRASDLQINELFKRWIPNPVLVVVDVNPTVGIPTDAYFAVEEIKDDGSSTSRTFVHCPSVIEAEEAEEIGVGHLLRDVRDQSTGTLSQRIEQQLRSLQGLTSRLHEIQVYLENVIARKLPVNHTILAALQDIFNLLPNLAPADAGAAAAQRAIMASADGDGMQIDGGGVDEDGVSMPGVHARDLAGRSESELAGAFRSQMHDSMMTVYLGSLVRAVMALHDLIDNRKTQEDARRERERDQTAKKMLPQPQQQRRTRTRRRTKTLQRKRSMETMSSTSK